jgi:hypothetical protein
MPEEMVKSFNRTTHGMSKTRFYSTYCHIKSRCERKENSNYNRYWWRWIKCWWKCFEDFKEEMYEEYIHISNIIWEKNVSIERIDNDKDYIKNNCKWVHISEQSWNRRINRYITYKWETFHLRKWSKILWISESALRARLDKHWWSIEKSFSTPMKTSTIYEYDWVKWEVWYLTKVLWVSKKTIYRRWKIIFLWNKNY